MHKLLTAAVVSATSLLAAPAFAHVTGVAHEAGAGHPVFGIDHLLVLLAVGVVAGVVVVRNRRR